MTKQAKLTLLLSAAGYSPREIEDRLRYSKSYDINKVNDAYQLYLQTRSAFHAKAAVDNLSYTIAPL